MRLFKGSSPSYRLSINNTEHDAPIIRGQTILEAARAGDIQIPNMCTVGECGTCRCQVTEGQVKLKRDITHHIPIDEIREGHVLACQSIALSELKVTVPGFGNQMSEASINGSIAQIKTLTHDIVEVKLKLAQPVRYIAGQYARLSVPGIEKLSRTPRNYSFAAPAPEGGTDKPVFYIRHVPGGDFTDWLFSQDRTGAPIVLEKVYGDFHYHTTDRPVLCFAGGSGIAPIKALLQHMQIQKQFRPVTFFFGARREEDLLWQEGLQQIQADWPEPFRYLPVLSEEPTHSRWQGRRGYITEHLHKEVQHIGNCDAYLCGPPEMVDAIETALRADIPPERIHCDKFLDQRSVSALKQAQDQYADIQN
ncbi:Xylene monooxygenase electron transfer component [Pseudovibrio axinellae]|uniref:Xylene monooxygenase electron transfer component n=1 Tax=Pseudovibrio axinellae TaxID=989403 RepID=A0A165ZSV4_9HYPH|nr:2Fe-2S iron-sulfur cluster binding domain-containing protein [Pseudovibrio axinellae]KZL20237.1 Xylene monooxygenase electron transfer component [Pseudovibrio axinellae]SEQ62186.1 NAD(P)H-flavin reductase [Pseudovibrio axinellae]